MRDKTLNSGCKHGIVPCLPRFFVAGTAFVCYTYYIAKIVNQVDHVSQLLQRHSWEFLCQSFEITIAMATEYDFIYCDPPYIGRHVDYYDSWDEESEIALHAALVGSKAKFMLSTWDHNDFRANEYIQTLWNDCQRITREHFYHVGAKEANRNPVVEALLTNYTITGTQNQLLTESSQISLFEMVPAIG